MWDGLRGRYVDVEDDEKKSPQEITRCACPSYSDPLTCIADRYDIPYSRVMGDERCECICHDFDYDCEEEEE